MRINELSKIKNFRTITRKLHEIWKFCIFMLSVQMAETLYIKEKVAISFTATLNKHEDIKF